MDIILYKSAFCPRCHAARKYLLDITLSEPEIKVKEIDVLNAPRQSWKDGIRMIPALKIGNNILSALFLSKSDIAEFIARHKH